MLLVIFGGGATLKVEEDKVRQEEDRARHVSPRTHLTAFGAAVKDVALRKTFSHSRTSSCDCPQPHFELWF